VDGNNPTPQSNRLSTLDRVTELIVVRTGEAPLFVDDTPGDHGRGRLVGWPYLAEQQLALRHRDDDPLHSEVVRQLNAPASCCGDPRRGELEARWHSAHSM
jgi:hypothetical protein